MVRLRLSVAVLLLAAAPVPAVPVPKVRRPAYFPTAVGSKWVYHLGDRLVVEVVTAVERRDGATVVTYGQPEPDGTLGCEYVMAVSNAGLRYGVCNARSGTTRLYSYYWCELKQPVVPGETWESDILVGNSNRKMRFTTLGVERVAVPAGEYEAVKVASELVLPDGSKQERTSWYAPGVGRVKWGLEGDREMVLVSFTDGNR